MVTGSDSPSSADQRFTFVDSGFASGDEQMETDRALLEALGGGRSGPVFRVYGWKPPAVSLGFHQDPDREVDRALVEARGYGLVRRPTGGRAILHADELTYAVVARIDDTDFGGSVRESHLAISRVFKDALRRLGVPATLACEEGRPALPVGAASPRRRDAGAAPPCFATAAGAELLVGGRKILGSAQRRAGDVFLQHGSLLLSDAHLELADFLRVADRAEAHRLLMKTTTSLERETGARPDRGALVFAVQEALGERLGERLA
jgi:lipoate-protein ligase A